jgi:hypothetical protein
MYEVIALFWLCEYFTTVPMFLVIKSLDKIKLVISMVLIVAAGVEMPDEAPGNWHGDDICCDFFDSVRGSISDTKVQTFILVVAMM